MRDARESLEEALEKAGYDTNRKIIPLMHSCYECIRCCEVDSENLINFFSEEEVKEFLKNYEVEFLIPFTLLEDINLVKDVIKLDSKRRETLETLSRILRYFCRGYENCVETDTQSGCKGLRSAMSSFTQAFLDVLKPYEDNEEIFYSIMENIYDEIMRGPIKEITPCRSSVVMKKMEKFSKIFHDPDIMRFVNELYSPKLNTVDFVVYFLEDKVEDVRVICKYIEKHKENENKMLEIKDEIVDTAKYVSSKVIREIIETYKDPDVVKPILHGIKMVGRYVIESKECLEIKKDAVESAADAVLTFKDDPKMAAEVALELGKLAYDTGSGTKVIDYSKFVRYRRFLENS